MTQSAINGRMLYSIEGSLKDVIPQFEHGSWRTAAEITQERLTNLELRDIGFYTANFSMHTVEDCDGRDAEFLYLGERAIILRARSSIAVKTNHTPWTLAIPLVARLNTVTPALLMRSISIQKRLFIQSPLLICSLG